MPTLSSPVSMHLLLYLWLSSYSKNGTKMIQLLIINGYHLDYVYLDEKNHVSWATETSFWIMLSEEVLTFKGLCDRWKQKADRYELPFNYWTLVRKWDKCAPACRTHCTFVPFQTWKETKSYFYILFCT